jgi:ribosome-binding factor A
MTQHLPYDRAERVADVIRRIVAESLVREISDPRLREAQVMRVTMTRDLRIARIYYHLFDASEEGRSRAAEGFRSASGFLRRRIGQELTLKFTPEVEFYYDESIEVGERIAELIENVKGGGQDE